MTDQTDSFHIRSGGQKIASAGSSARITLETGAKSKWNTSRTVIIQAHPSNNGNVAIGGVDVAVGTTPGTDKGIILEPGKSLTLLEVDLRGIYFDVATNDDGITWLIVN